MAQLALFEEEPWAVDQFVYETNDIAVIYTCAKSGKTSHVRMFTTVQDAMKLCSHESTQGTVHGSQWITMWTRIERLLSVLGDNPRIPVEDDGRFLPLCERLEIIPIPVTDVRIAKWLKLVGR